MQSKLLVSALAIILAGFTAAPAHAQIFGQNPLSNLVGNYLQRDQNWQNRQQNQISQDVNSGLLTPYQAGQLQNKEAQISLQEQKYMSQNGGSLTPWQQSKIRRELKGVSRKIHNDVRNNTGGSVLGNLFNGGYTPAYYNTNPGLITPVTGNPVPYTSNVYPYTNNVYGNPGYYNRYTHRHWWH